MDELDQALTEIATVLNTGSTSDQPAKPEANRWFTGICAGSPVNGKLPVSFPQANGTTQVQNLRYLLNGYTPAVGEKVLVQQLGKQRLVFGAISH